MDKQNKQEVDVVNLLKRHKDAVARRDKMRPLYQEAQEYTQPERNLWANAAEGQEKSQLIYDSTAVQAAQRGANRIQSDMMPPFQKWAVMKAGPFVPDGQSAEVNKVLSRASDLVAAVISSSNFDTVINEVLQDWMIGTGIMLVTETDDINTPLIFTAIPHAHCALEEGPNSSISAVFRDHNVKLRDIKKTWSDATPTADMTANSAKQDKEYKFVEAAYENARNDWTYCVIEEKTKTTIVSRSYQDNPFIVIRASKLPGEVWGRGQIISALPDIRTLNKLVEFILRYAALRIAGIWGVKNDGILNPNNLSIVPGMVLPMVQTSGPNAGMVNLAPQGDMSLAGLEQEKLTMNIKKALFDQALPPDAGAVRSATEIMERVKELLRDIGGPYSRLMTELVYKLYQRILDMLYRKGHLKERIVVDGMNTRIQLLSPMALVQNIADVENVVRWLQIMASFGTEFMYLSAVMEKIGGWLGEKLGVPADLIRSDGQKEAIQQMVGQIVAKQQMAAATPAGQGIAQGNTIPMA